MENDIPEIAEVEKLKRQIEPAFVGRSVVGFKNPNQLHDPTTVAVEGWQDLKSKVLNREVTSVERIGKNLWLRLSGQPAGGWHLHFNSTGWLMPGNEAALKASVVNPIHENFLHKIVEKGIRIKIHLSDGQVWNYHDPRTWGKWYFKSTDEQGNQPYFSTYGPDWLRTPVSATSMLLSSKSTRTTKDVLCDQKLAAGIGNYLACEICHAAGVHPHARFHTLSQTSRTKLAYEAMLAVKKAMESDNHEHWRVFRRKGQPCPICTTPVSYVKDAGDARGSYFCNQCQPKT